MNKISDLQAGKAGEYLACADIITKGHTAFLADKGSRFDAIMEFNGRLFRLQIKSTRGPLLASSTSKIPVYCFNIGVNGKLSKRRQYGANEVDIFALVDLQNKRVAYIPYRDALKSMKFRVPELRGQYYNEHWIKWVKVIGDLKKEGYSISEIQKKTGTCESHVRKFFYKYDVKPKGNSISQYFDEFSFEKCMDSFTI